MSYRTTLIATALVAGAAVGAIIVTHFGVNETVSETAVPASSASIVERLKKNQNDELDAEQLEQVVNSLVQVLDEEIAERRILAEQLEATRSELADLQQNLRARVERAFEEGRLENPDGPSANIEQARVSFEQANRERLIAAGFAPEQVEYLQRRQAEAEMQQVELDDRARREGWVGTARYAQELSNLTSGPETVRGELGDDAYDRYLFASRRSNRVAVGSVIQTSPAERAGLRPGDIIRSYGGERIFTPDQLTRLRSTGDRGAAVAVEILRDGKPMLISMPRGPMGIQTQPTRADPGS